MRAVLAGAVLLCLLGTGFPGDIYAATTIKIATVAPEGSTWMNLMNDLSTKVKEDTDGRVKLRFYPGGIQGDETLVLRKIWTKQLQGAGLTGVGLGEMAPELRVMELPLLFSTQEDVKRVHKKMDPEFEKILAEKGFTLLGWSEVGFIYLFSKTPVRNDKDLKRLKVWLWEGDPLAEAFLGALDVSPVPLAVTDVMTGLQTGLVEAVYISPLASIALQWFTRVKYMTDMPLTHALGAVVVKTDALEGLSDQDRETLMRHSREIFAQLAIETERENNQALEVLKERGITFVTPDAGSDAAFQKIGRKVREELTGRLYDQALLNRVLAALKTVRENAATEATH
ncbi:MAG: TRAP transporter substrate-binding protein DctP [Candidatus Eisenbacteria bacterium]|uniref:TRAP transporter substrate-binding protein DctP n=1 Tax=Eiseniibacteriota bacterium TaxID=2212470 RepID=A0A948RZ97_UNCEI|nr:TRAP transporter substrate-binding protein DctP [Candidatus Eisenbacteria bacterium]MBU1948669.1 TRAP transporter substrate-binding protein DctP [Candidatus Eisenbacteria bacterium]MBU2690979.1 TRAP transporter substrate-binding protein DctP [Candidatus Eisenbacteria bacterium]